MRRIVALAVVLAALGAVPAARAADPGRWTLTGTSTLPIQYYQGVTVDPLRNLYFDGVYVGVYRTDSGLTETGRNDDVIPPEVHLREGYNHIGDLSWDPREGGRLLLPMECYVPGGPNGGNSCQTGSIGVADPQTLQWRYYVRLDPAEIPKAMFVETSPDGELLWTSSGQDLLAYRSADVSQANAAPGRGPIKSVRRLKNAVPPSGITGATFIDGRFYVAGQDGGPFRVWSIDLATGARRLEIERQIVGESEGLATASVKDGILQWLIQPYNTENKPPTYAPSNATLLSFRPTAATGVGPALPPGGGAPTTAKPTISLLRRSRATVLRRRGFAARLRCPSGCSAALSVARRGGPVLARASTQGSAGRSARVPIRLTAGGRRLLRSRRGPLRLTLRAAVRGPSGTTTRLLARSTLR